MGWLALAVAVAAFYQVLVLVGLAVAWRNPRVPHEHDPGSLGIGFTEVWIPTAGGRSLYGWWIPAGEADAPVVVLVHGWGRNVERMLPYVAMLHPAGFHLLAFDARNHGRSGADRFASLKKFSEDVRAAVAFAAARPEARRIGVLGLSIGGAAAIHAAAREPRIAAVVSVGAFASPADAMLPPARWRWLLLPGMPLALRFVEWRIGASLADLAPEASIARAGAPFLLVHGADDAVVPVAHARRLAAAGAGRAELWVISGRGHSDPHLEAGFSERVTRFLATHLSAGAGRTE